MNTALAPEFNARSISIVVVLTLAGGADRPGNMQWLTVAGAKKKERADAAECRKVARQRKS